MASPGSNNEMRLPSDIIFMKMQQDFSVFDTAAKLFIVSSIILFIALITNTETVEVGKNALYILLLISLALGVLSGAVRHLVSVANEKYPKINEVPLNGQTDTSMHVSVFAVLLWTILPVIVYLRVKEESLKKNYRIVAIVFGATGGIVFSGYIITALMGSNDDSRSQIELEFENSK